MKIFSSSGDIVNDTDDDDDDDEVRTSVSQNHATATLITKEFFLRTQYVFIALPSYQQRGVYSVYSQRHTYEGSQLGSSF
jgi:hypothetical protein